MDRNSSFSFAPSRTGGVLFFIAIIPLFIGAELFLLNLISRVVFGLPFFLLIIAVIVLALPLGFLVYRFFSLLYSRYNLERDGLHIQWGLRSEVIPLNAIEWVRRPEEMPYDVPWSFLPMPGAYLGTVPSEDFGQFEFLASDTKKMLFLGTARRVYAISPKEPELFVAGFERILQLGSLQSIDWKSIRPAGWLTDVWRNSFGKIAVIGGINLLTILYLWIGFRFQGRRNVALLFSSTGKAEENLPVDSVMILPALATLCWVLGMILGIRLYRSPRTKRIAEPVFCFVLLAVAQFLVAAFLIF